MLSYHPFLRSTHSFDPAQLESTESEQKGEWLAFEVGDVLLLHSRHASGWGDASSLVSGSRGWVPVSYCEPFDSTPVQPLLVAALNLVLSPRETMRIGQIAVDTMVSGVRCLLDLTHCTTRDSYAVIEYDDIRRTRRALLAELAALVKLAKDSPRSDSIGDDMIQCTYRIVCKAAQFLDVYSAQEQEDPNALPALPSFASSEHLLRSERSSYSSGSVTYDLKPVSALTRLNFLYDVLLVCMSSFLEIKYDDIHAPAQLLLTTRQSVHAARELLAVVETIAARASPVVYSLDEAKEAMYMRVTSLVTAAREVVAAQTKTDNGQVSSEAENLVMTVILCLGAAGLCLAKSKFVIDRIGDFKLDVDRRQLEQHLRAQLGLAAKSAAAVEAFEETEMEKLAFPASVRTNEKFVRTPLQDRVLFNADGQVQGGSLEALVKQLTANDATPDALFVATFFLTFRSFTNPVAFAQALIHRFSSLSPDEPNVLAARLRVYNAFKGWMESHWRRQTDNEALPLIIDFANGALKTHLPFARTRLLDLSQRVDMTDKPLVPRSMSKLDIDASLGILLPDSLSVPTPIVTRQFLVTVGRYVQSGGDGPAPMILEFDPLELARQITIKESRLFCQIVPEELLSQEFSKKSGRSTAVNVKAMSSLSTDLANYISETVLAGDVPIKVRTTIIRHWIRVAEKCLELKNYNCLMAIMCALQSSVIWRLKKTWELLPLRYHSLFTELKSIIVYEKNYASYRTLLKNQSTPCLPYLGLYLTDLTFADEGNSDYRMFRPDTPDASPVINFDKHVRTTKIIADLQRFQVPYRFQGVPELQAWLDLSIAKTHEMCVADQHMLYRRSCIIEPKPVQHHEPDVLGWQDEKIAK
ncbi:ras guanine nucleotide exchange factor domain-containing protein [Lipomyces arxii]|uniref:ras guanine nucleotide exchange factor domain-containing protein n=1 Tax=Lipomyces arxii TaxID=56418 RepID=UPI0034CE18EF